MKGKTILGTALIAAALIAGPAAAADRGELPALGSLGQFCAASCSTCTAGL